MDRRKFLFRCGGTLLAIPTALKLAGCYAEDGDGYGSNPPPASDDDAIAVSVMNSDASGHSHSFEIRCAHATKDGWTYTAGGGHSHAVVLSAEQLRTVFGGGSVTIETADGHPHTWVITMPSNRC